MSHYCNAPNRTKSGTCARRLRSAPHCHSHRSALVARVYATTVRNRSPELADVLVGEGCSAEEAQVSTGVLHGVHITVADQHWDIDSCRKLASVVRAACAVTQVGEEGARAVLSLGIPPPLRAALTHLASFMVLPWSIKFRATVHALQLYGVLRCAAQGIPVQHCPCAGLYTRDASKELLAAALGG